jgi:hypothetical protein
MHGWEGIAQGEFLTIDIAAHHTTLIETAEFGKKFAHSLHLHQVLPTQIVSKNF